MSAVTKRVYYKVLAEVETATSKKQRAYWFAEHKSFLVRQRDKTTGKASIKIACNSKQRAAIRGLVKTFDLAAATA